MTARTGRAVGAVSAAGTIPAPDQPLRRSPVPIREPRAAVRVRPSVVDEIPPTQGTLALALPATTALREDVRGRGTLPVPAAGGPSSAPVRTGSRSATNDAGRSPNRARPAGVLPEPREWAATFALAAMEVASGLRPAGQLIRWTSPEVHEALSLRGALNARRRQGPATGPARTAAPARLAPASRLSPAARKVYLRALVAGIPVDGVCEVAAVVRGPDRIRAVAFRMEGHAGRWRVTALQIG